MAGETVAVRALARLRLPAQRFDSDDQLRFADALRYNPWHCLPEHRPLGSSNRARRRMYAELAELRQTMNGARHVEPTGAETFDDPAASPPTGTPADGAAAQPSDHLTSRRKP